MNTLALRRGTLTVSAVLLVLIAAWIATFAGRSPGVTMPAVLTAGFLDGLNPCAIAVLLVFVSALLGSVERTSRTGVAARGRILAGGSAYIAGMFITYFALGVGLLGSVTFLQESHLVARIAALIAIGLGLMTLQEALVPEWGERLVMPAAFHDRARGLSRSASLPALFVAGGLIGLCTVPCSGSVYLATVALLSQKATYLAGISYLAIYNLMFVAPLVLLLGFATSRPTYRLLARAQLRARSSLKLLLGTATVGVGLLTLAAM